METGDSLPALEVVTNTGTVSLSEYTGGKLVLYFYPKDNTPGCTTEGSDFRDLYPQFQQQGAEIFGVSKDSVRSHQSFVDKLKLPFALISDGDGALCEVFDVIKPKKMYGKEYIGIERSTFVFEQGVLTMAWRKVRVPDHANQVLAYIQGNAQ